MDTKTTLLRPLFARLAEAIAAGGSTGELRWREIASALAATGETDDELALIVESRDAGALRDYVAGWTDGSRPPCEQDKAVVKRAMKAFRKRLKVTRLDAESSLGGGPMSSGRKSLIIGVKPPSQYPREVWDECVRLGRLVDAGQGMYELPEDQ